MPVDEITFEAEEKMEKTVDVMRDELRVIRTGRAHPGLVENIKAEYYGTMTPLKQMANISSPDPQLIVIKPYDPSSLKDIERALLQSSIGIAPNNDGKLIRLAVPSLSEERRKQLAAQVKDMAEQSKVALRNIRREANKHIDQEQKDGIIAEDDAYGGKEEMQDLISQYEKKIDGILDAKTQEIMEI